MKTTKLSLILLATVFSLSVNAQDNKLTPAEKKDGWKLLFDGKTTNGWRSAFKDQFPGGSKGWEAKDGLLTIHASNGGESSNAGDIVTVDEYGAFDLKFEFKMSRGANSGIKYFVTLKEDSHASAIGLEYQILDDDVHPDAKLGRDGNRKLASLYDLIPSNKPAAVIKPVGEWNTGEIKVFPNNHVEHWLNGVKVLEYERKSPAYRELVKISKYKVWPNFGEADKGHILLQDHGFDVNFRNVKIKTL